MAVLILLSVLIFISSSVYFFFFVLDFVLRSKCKSVAVIFGWLSVCFLFIFCLFKILKVDVDQV